MSMDRAQRRALEREQRKGRKTPESVRPVSFDGTPSLWLALLVALPLVAVPLYYVYIPPGTLIEGGYGQIIIN